MEKLKMGDQYQENVRFTQKDVNLFADVSGDRNPIHIDEAYAAKTPFGKPIVHGFLAGSVFSKVFGMNWPGEGTIYLYQDMSFRAPVFVEKNYVAKFEIIEHNQERNRATVQCTLEDEEGNQAIIGVAKLLNKKML
ncbi:MAG TPA: MaoC family dehydratase [Bacteroidales bacterium]|nr:MaoC family dehydratase [Bacteroidales bacterium]HOH22587.1 MaoC family dehydratase [Bacteroidales bacterium]HPZ03929.1 MaoC family dehydratase [Bacteroidales bacterium]HQB75479.1 MaoC family dehydratase [Bacteroidales bacterium]